MQRVMQSGSSSAMSATSGMFSSSWILDSGATHHMTSDATCLADLSSVSSSSSVRTADGTLLPVMQCGRLTTPALALPDVHYVPASLQTFFLLVSLLIIA